MKKLCFLLATTLLLLNNAQAASGPFGASPSLENEKCIAWAKDFEEACEMRKECIRLYQAGILDPDSFPELCKLKIEAVCNMFDDLSAQSKELPLKNGDEVQQFCQRMSDLLRGWQATFNRAFYIAGSVPCTTSFGENQHLLEILSFRRPSAPHSDPADGDDLIALFNNEEATR
ncbi:hypothetical protein EBZ39_10700 [bacterium]|nr:hypothetical protein [bacterium]